MKIDSWNIVMRMQSPKVLPCDAIAPVELPQSLGALHPVAKTDSDNMDNTCAFRGIFSNYFSMGMDAQVSYAFHSHERKLHPEKFKNQLLNQVKIMKNHGHWEKLHIPHSIRSIVCLNLPSFSGGLNPWCTPDNKKQRERDLTAPYVDDGLLEIVGFKDGWHGLVLLSPKGHGTRLAQAHCVKFKFRKGAVNHAYMRIDGEPWKQPLPEDDGKVVVEISNLGQIKILATENCIAKSIHNGSTCHFTESIDNSSESTVEGV